MAADLALLAMPATDVDQHAGGGFLGSCEGFPYAQNRIGAGVDTVEQVDPLLQGARGYQRRDLLPELGLPGDERSLAQIRAPGRLAEASPQRRFQATESKVTPVRGLVYAVAGAAAQQAGSGGFVFTGRQ